MRILKPIAVMLSILCVLSSCATPPVSQRGDIASHSAPGSDQSAPLSTPPEERTTIPSVEDAQSALPEAPEPSEVSVPPEEAVTLEVCWERETNTSAVITGADDVSAIREIAEGFSLSDYRNLNTDVTKVGDYFKSRVSKGGPLYYAFYNEAVTEIPQLQQGNNPKAAGRTNMPLEQYLSLYALWEEYRELPKDIIVQTKSESIKALVLRANRKARPEEVRDKISYLKIERHDGEGPFHVYAGGTEQFGTYRIWDAETLEELEFFRPSGLAPQTYILQKAQTGRRYIVQLFTGYTVSGQHYGFDLFFGIDFLE